MICFGCRLANQQEPVHIVWENEDVCCILDHAPFNEGHVLVMPKKHIRYFDEMDKRTASSVMEAIGIVSRALKEVFHPDGITVCQNGGIFDELTHLHLHIIPRYEGQNFADFYVEDEENQCLEAHQLQETKRKLARVIKS